jgi:putative CocE/NonD family hydrolase
MRNPRHTCMRPKAAAGATRYFGVISGGAIDLLTTVEWFRVAGAKVHPQYLPGITTEELRRAAPYYRLAPSLPEIDRDAIVRSLPVIEQLQKAGAPPSDFEGFVSHAPGDPWWEQFGYVDARDRFDVPALLLDSWNDYGVADTLRFFNLLGSNSESARGRDNRFVVIGPGTHCSFERASEHTMAGERDLGDARFDYDGLYLRWFDHWLRGAGDGAFDQPRVTYYVMGSGAWKTAGDWPIPGTRFTDWYLHSGGRANSRFGDGTLSGDAPGDEPPDRFTYDPATPVPRLGGPVGVGGVPAGSFDQREIETRHDVLVYTSDALAEGIEVTGPLELVLYVSSSARDTDFTARLIDVYPDGRAYNVQEGILRARYRAGYGRTVWLAPDEVVELRIDLQATSNFFGPGHRVRLEVSSSNFPRWDRNLNTGGNNFDETAWVVAHNTVHHSARYPSRLVLPIVE